MAVAIASLSLPFMAGPGSAATLNGFEIDGNRLVDSVPNDDWSSVSASPRYSFAHDDIDTDTHDTNGDGIADFTGDRTIFQAGKELNDPSTWVLTRGTNDNGSDIGDHYAYYTIDASGDAWFYFGFKRTEVGNAGFSVELNRLPNVNGRPQRSIGDVIIALYQTTGSTAFQLVSVKQLTATGWTTSTIPAGDFNGATGESGTFGEIGINLTHAGLQPNCTGGFSTVNARSRASSSQTSDLKDYIVPMSVSIPDRCKKLVINKLGPDGQPLGGATFTLNRNPITGQLGDYVVTDGGANDPDGQADGVISIRTDVLVEYVVTETSAPVGYIRQTTPESTTVTPFADGSVTFRNYLGALSFEKVDAVSKAKIGYATFRLTKATGAQGPFVVVDNNDHEPGAVLAAGDTVVQDSDPDTGEVRVDGLRLGGWTVTEIAPPDGYRLPSMADRSQDVTITQPAVVGENYDVVPTALRAPFEDPRELGSLVVKKYAAGTDELITGTAGTSAQFTLYVDVNENGVFDSGTDVLYAADPGPKSALDGTASWNDLPWGSYLVQESRAPQGYQPAAQEYKPFVIDRSDVVGEPNQPEVVEFYNRQVVSSLSVVKHDADDDTVVPGATFQLYRESNGSAGLQFGDAGGDTLVQTCTTAADTPGTAVDESVCRTGDLSFGTYYWIETGAPEGYELPPLQERLDFADAHATTIDRANAGSAFPTLTITDPKKLTSLRVAKVDAVTGERVGGATFQLYRETNGTGGLQVQGLGVSGPYDELVGSCQTSAGDPVCSVADLSWGDYYWLETVQPEGYQLPSLEKRVAQASGQVVTIDSANAGTSLDVTEIEDDQVRSELRVVKVDDVTGHRVGGATFQLYRESNGIDGLQDPAGSGKLDEPVGAECTTAAVDDPATTADERVCTRSGLTFGTYYWVEVAAPTGYVLPDFPASVSDPVVVGPTNAGTAFATVEIRDDQVRSELSVVKVDADAPGTVVDGAVFQLWREDNGVAGLQPVSFSDAQGDHEADLLVEQCAPTTNGDPCSVGDLLFGTYYWFELSAPTGYVLPEESVRLALADENKVEVTPETAGSDFPVVEIADPQVRSTLEVIKHDADTGQVVAGATFELWQESNGVSGLQRSATQSSQVAVAADTLVGECTTQAASPCSVSNELLFGTYYWYESDAPTGYLLPAPEQRTSAPITLSAANALAPREPVVIADPEKRSELHVLKRDADTGSVVDGAVFQLFEESNGTAGLQTGADGDTLVGDCTTAGQDPCSVGGLLFGTYYWYEAKAPTGYVLPTGSDRVSGPIVVDAQSAAAGEYATTVIEDAQVRSELAVVKHDADTGNVVDGAVFTLYRESNGTAGLQVGQGGDDVAGTCTTSAGEPCSIRGLTFGTYYWYELSAPTGYELPSGSDRVSGPIVVDAQSAAAGEYATTVIEDAQVRSELAVVKHDADTGKVVDGAVFQLFEESNGTAGLQTGADGDILVGDCTTSGQDPCSVGGLLFGTYYWYELSAPTGYELPSDSGRTSGPIVVDAQSAAAGDYTTTVIKDAQVRSELAVIKHDAHTGKVVDGAVFQLFEESNGTAGLQTGADGDTLVGDCTTAGQDPCSVGGLLFGTYYWYEAKAPTGYELPSDSGRVSGPIVVDAQSAAAGEFATTVIEDAQVRSELAVVKHDADTGNVVDGAVFQLFEESNGLPGLQTQAFSMDGAGYRADQLVQQCEPTTNGEPCAVGGLLFGTYYWFELSAPTGYELPRDSGRTSGPIVVDAQSAAAGDYATTVIEDAQVRSELGVIKHDADTGSVVDGATFTLYRESNDSAGLQVGQGGDTAVGDCTTAGREPCAVDGLTFGTYYWYEAKAPRGYDLPAAEDRASLPIVVDAQSAAADDYPVTVIEDPQTRSGLSVVKRDADTGDVADGAVFQLYRETNAAGGLQQGEGGDRLVEQCRPTANAEPCTVDGLLFGTYYWYELSAPTGYELPAPEDRVSKPVVVDAESAAADDYPTTVISDPEKRTSLEVVKVDDETHEVLAGAGFQVYEDDGSEPGVLDETDTPVGDPVTTDAEGIARWSGLLFGHYLVEEVTAPEGYDLPAEAVQAVTIDQDNAGGIVRLTFLDPAQGTVTITKTGFERMRGTWVETDGHTDFNHLVKYVVTVSTDGPRIHRNVTVSDFVPGYDPDDETSDTRGIYVAGSAACREAGSCAVSFDSKKQLLTWDLGDLRNQTRSVEFVIRFPSPKSSAMPTKGRYVETLANTATLAWTDRGGDQDTESNQVLVDAEIRILGVVEERPRRPRPPVDILPETGAPSNTGLWTTIGGLMVTFGAALLIRRRRQQS